MAPVLAAMLAVFLGLTAVKMPLIAVGTAALVGVAALVAGGPKVVLYAVLMLFPLLPANVTLGSPLLTLQRVMLGLLLFALVAEVRFWRRGAEGLGLLRHPVAVFGAFLSVGLIAASVSPLPVSALGGVTFYALQVAVPLIAGFVIVRGGDSERYLAAAVVGAIGVSALAAVQYVAPHVLTGVLGPVFTTDQASIDTVRALSQRVSGPFAHPVSMGAYCAITLPVALRAAASAWRPCAVLGRVAVVALLATIMLSQTRMAMLAAVAVIGLAIVLSSRRKELLALVASAAVIMVFVFGIGALAAQTSILSSALSYRGESIGETTAKQNVAGRTSLYVTGWRAFQERPLVGYGMRVPTNHAQSPVFMKYGQAYAFESYAVVLPLEVGVVGVGVLAAFLFSLLHVARRAIASRRDLVAFYGLLTAGAVLAVGANLFSVEISYLWLLVGVIMGIGVSSQAARVLGRPSEVAVRRIDEE